MGLLAKLSDLYEDPYALYFMILTCALLLLARYSPDLLKRKNYLGWPRRKQKDGGEYEKCFTEDFIAQLHNHISSVLDRVGPVGCEGLRVEQVSEVKAISYFSFVKRTNTCRKRINFRIELLKKKGKEKYTVSIPGKGDADYFRYDIENLYDYVSEELNTWV